MKTFSPNKLLTAVVLVIVSFNQQSFGFDVSCSAAQNSSNRQTCETEFKKCVGRKKDSSEFAEYCKKQNEANILDCVKTYINASIDEYCGDKPGQEAINGAKQECKSAMKDYNEVLKKTGNVCSKFESTGKSTKNSCKDRVEACRKKIRNGLSGSSSNDSTALMQTMASIYMQKNYPEAAAQSQNSFMFDTGEGMGQSCVKYQSKDDRKEAKQDAEKLEDKVAKIKEKIADEKKKINEENAKLREKNDDLAVKRNEVDEKLKEEIAKMDKDKQAKATAIAKEISENSNTIRKLNTQIVKFKEEAESVKFDYSQKMVQFAEDKVSTQCSTAIDTAKACFIKNSKSKTTDPKDTCANFNLTAKGAKGTAELKDKLQKIKDACFEQANLTTKKASYEQAKSLRNIESNITEYTAQINAANQSLQQKQKEYQEIANLGEQDRTNSENNASKQLEQLSQKADNLTKSTNEAIQHSNTKVMEFQKELDDINTKKMAQKMGIADQESVEYSFSEAETAIDEQENTRVVAQAACCTSNDTKTQNESFCKKLDDASTSKSQKDAGFKANRTGGSSDQ